MASETREWLGWRDAAEYALYGPEGFFRRTEGPAGHFRTSVHASPRYAAAVAELLTRVDRALGHPDELALVDMGAGRGELLTGVLACAAEIPGWVGGKQGGRLGGKQGERLGGERDGPLDGSLVERLRPYAVERAPRPPGLDPRITWLGDLGELPHDGRGGLDGLLFANEWLDNVPVDVVETDADGAWRQVLVAPEDGAERLGGPVGGADADWLARWWPSARDSADEPGLRAEVGRPRDEAWAEAVRTLRSGLAVAVDYAHERGARPPFGTLTGFREGREVRPVPDGSCDLTSHVAIDACAAAGAAALRGAADSSPPDPSLTPVTLPQRAALRALGVEGRRPPLALATDDPAAYVRALSGAGEAAELLDPAGLGGFTWLLQPTVAACGGLLGPGQADPGQGA
ncbi:MULTISPECIES: SAM-dependent methyltransferase [unclassified Streptomyces]|uniref:SAM-dependent methyltransferase n=1 Tax=unclassified Streptomyces TaxID=2593676 RepID=UPI00336AA0CC